MKIVADNNIPGLSRFLSPTFDLEVLPLAAINSESLRHADILIGRSVLRVNRELLENTAVKIVATSSSGIDHIDISYLEERGIKLFSAPGSNAQGVADYILWMVAYLEKNKLLSGKQAGIIGAGYVGAKVNELLTTLNFDVVIHDPPKALIDPHFVSTDLDDIAQQDLICVHAALTRHLPYPSYHMLSNEWLKKVRKNASFINAARGAILDTQALLNQNKPLNICCDVFENEPNISKLMLEKCLVVTPHIAGHTVESFYRGSHMIAQSLNQLIGDAKFAKNVSFQERKTKTIDATECQHWYDIILKLYEFRTKVELSSMTFYTLREFHRVRHDFSTMIILINHCLPTSERLLLKKLQLNLQEKNDAT